MVTLKDVLDLFECKHRFANNVEAIDLGEASFESITYDYELILFTNSFNPDIILRIDQDRRNIYMYEGINEKDVKVTHWLILRIDTRKLNLIVPRERVKM